MLTATNKAATAAVLCVWLTCRLLLCCPLQGGPAEGEGQETLGCPVYSHPAQLTDNRNCVLCMTCLKACPHR